MNNYTIQRIIIVTIIIMTIVIVTNCLSSPNSSPNQSSGTAIPNESTSNSTTTQKLPVYTPNKTNYPSPTMTEGQVPIPTVPPECIAIAKGAGTYLQILSDSQQPLSSISMSVMSIASNCPTEIGPFTKNTNASGWAYLGAFPANYYFNVSLRYKEKGYNFSISQLPLYTTYATLKLPSGNLTVTLCNPKSTEVCKPYDQK